MVDQDVNVGRSSSESDSLKSRDLKGKRRRVIVLQHGVGGVPCELSRRNKKNENFNISY